MALEGYPGAKEIPMSPEAAKAFDEGFKKIFDAIAASGMKPAGMSFTATEHTLTISTKEAQSGAWHIYADGNPFYIVTMTVQASMMEATGMPADITQATPRQQGAYLGFEIGLNLMTNMDKFLQVGNDQVHGGGSFQPFEVPMTVSSCLRYPPDVYCDVLSAVIKERIADVKKAKAAKPG